MNKLELAHDYAKMLLGDVIDRDKIMFDSFVDDIADYAFRLAEAMLAENEKRQDKSRPEVLGEWQPDWSQAPAGANWWALDESREAFWFAYEPYVSTEYPDEWIFNGKNHGGLGFEYWKSSDFGYQGKWKDSLRKRP